MTCQVKTLRNSDDNIKSSEFFCAFGYKKIETYLLLDKIYQLV